MADNIPQDLFTTDVISEELKNKIKSIILFKQSLKEKYPKQFKEDTHDSYIHLDFYVPSFNMVFNKEEIKFNFQVSDALDHSIKEEFEKFVNSIIS